MALRRSGVRLPPAPPSILPPLSHNVSGSPAFVAGERLIRPQSLHVRPLASRPLCGNICGNTLGGRAAMALSATRVRALKDPGRFSDGGGLHLYISKAGSKSWVLRTTIGGRRRDIGLGGFPAVSLALAREKASEFRAAVSAGRDPLADRSRPPVPTFREAARAVHEANMPRWRNAKHAGSWLQVLERHAMPALGNTPIDRIDRSEVLRVLTPIWTSR